MPITSFVEEEGPGQGRGHYEHGQGKGLGHLKHADDAMSDGVYTLQIDGIDVDNPTATSITSATTALADGGLLNTEVRQGAITIDSVDGQGALHLVTDVDNGRLRLNVGLDEDQQVTLGDLDTLRFDYHVADSTRTDVIPVLRLVVDADGDLATTDDRGELVFEWAYQGAGAVPTDSWQTADLAGDDWTAWQRSLGVNHDQVANMTNLSDWADADGYTPAAGLHFDADSVVLGWSLALGSGNGATDAYVNNLTVGGVTYEFG